MTGHVKPSHRYAAPTRAVAFVILFCFGATSALWSAPALPTIMPDALISPTAFDPSSFSVPAEIADIREIFHGRADRPAVIHIQDAHCVYDAQKGIASLIDQFQKDYRLGLVALEGGEGFIDPLFFRAFPERDAKARVFGEYLKRSEISGAEYAAVMNDGESVFVGVEEKGLYQKNKQAYFNAVRAEPNITHELTRVRRALDELRLKRYSAPLTDLDRLVRDYRSDPKMLGVLLTELGRYAPADKHPTIQRVLELSASEEFQNNPEHMAHALAELAAERLFDEVDGFISEAKAALYPSPEAAALGAMYDRLDVLSDLARLRLTRKSLEAYRASRASYTPEAFKTFLESAGKYLDAYWNLEAHEEFYALALRRDEAMYRNFLKTLSRSKARIAFLITGGFHTDGITERLKKENITYVVLTPKINALGSDDTYRDVMEGKVSYGRYLNRQYDTLSPEAVLQDGNIGSAFSRDAAALLTDSIPVDNVRGAFLNWHGNIFRSAAENRGLSWADKATRYADRLRSLFEARTAGASHRAPQFQDVLHAVRSVFARHMPSLRPQRTAVGFGATLSAENGSLIERLKRKNPGLDLDRILREEILAPLEHLKQRTENDIATAEGLRPHPKDLEVSLRVYRRIVRYLQEIIKYAEDGWYAQAYNLFKRNIFPFMQAEDDGHLETDPSVTTLFRFALGEVVSDRLRNEAADYAESALRVFAKNDAGQNQMALSRIIIRDALTKENGRKPLSLNTRTVAIIYEAQERLSNETPDVFKIFDDLGIYDTLWQDEIFDRVEAPIAPSGFGASSRTKRIVRALAAGLLALGALAVELNYVANLEAASIRQYSITTNQIILYAPGTEPNARPIASGPYYRLDGSKKVPTGLTILDGKTETPFRDPNNLASLKAVFVIDQFGRLHIKPAGVSLAATVAPLPINDIRYAFQAGPMAVEGGVVNPRLREWADAYGGRKVVIGINALGTELFVFEDFGSDHIGKTGPSGGELERNLLRWVEENGIFAAMFVDGGTTFTEGNLPVGGKETVLQIGVVSPESGFGNAAEIAPVNNLNQTFLEQLAHPDWKIRSQAAYDMAGQILDQTLSITDVVAYFQSTAVPESNAQNVVPPSAYNLDQARSNIRLAVLFAISQALQRASEMSGEARGRPWPFYLTLQRVLNEHLDREARDISWGTHLDLENTFNHNYLLSTDRPLSLLEGTSIFVRWYRKRTNQESVPAEKINIPPGSLLWWAMEAVLRIYPDTETPAGKIIYGIPEEFPAPAKETAAAASGFGADVVAETLSAEAKAFVEGFQLLRDRLIAPGEKISLIGSGAVEAAGSIPNAFGLSFEDSSGFLFSDYQIQKVYVRFTKNEWEGSRDFILNKLKRLLSSGDFQGTVFVEIEGYDFNVLTSRYSREWDLVTMIFQSINPKLTLKTRNKNKDNRIPEHFKGFLITVLPSTSALRPLAERLPERRPKQIGTMVEEEMPDDFVEDYNLDGAGFSGFGAEAGEFDDHARALIGQVPPETIIDLDAAIPYGKNPNPRVDGIGFREMTAIVRLAGNAEFDNLELEIKNARGPDEWFPMKNIRQLSHLNISGVPGEEIRVHVRLKATDPLDLEKQYRALQGLVAMKIHFEEWKFGRAESGYWKVLTSAEQAIRDEIERLKKPDDTDGWPEPAIVRLADARIREALPKAESLEDLFRLLNLRVMPASGFGAVAAASEQNLEKIRSDVEGLFDQAARIHTMIELDTAEVPARFHFDRFSESLSSARYELSKPAPDLEYVQRILMAGLDGKYGWIAILDKAKKDLAEMDGRAVLVHRSWGLDEYALSDLMPALTGLISETGVVIESLGARGFGAEEFTADQFREWVREAHQNGFLMSNLIEDDDGNPGAVLYMKTERERHSGFVIARALKEMHNAEQRVTEQVKSMGVTPSQVYRLAHFLRENKRPELWGNLQDDAGIINQTHATTMAALDRAWQTEGVSLEDMYRDSSRPGRNVFYFLIFFSMAMMDDADLGRAIEQQVDTAAHAKSLWEQHKDEQGRQNIERARLKVSNDVNGLTDLAREMKDIHQQIMQSFAVYNLEDRWLTILSNESARRSELRETGREIGFGVIDPRVYPFARQLLELGYLALHLEPEPRINSLLAKTILYYFGLTPDVSTKKLRDDKKQVVRVAIAKSKPAVEKIQVRVNEALRKNNILPDDVHRAALEIKRVISLGQLVNFEVDTDVKINSIYSVWLAAGVDLKKMYLNSEPRGVVLSEFLDLFSANMMNDGELAEAIERQNDSVQRLWERYFEMMRLAVAKAGGITGHISDDAVREVNAVKKDWELNRDRLSILKQEKDDREAARAEVKKGEGFGFQKPLRDAEEGIARLIYNEQALTPERFNEQALKDYLLEKLGIVMNDADLHELWLDLFLIQMRLEFFAGDGAEKAERVRLGGVRFDANMPNHELQARAVSEVVSNLREIIEPARVPEATGSVIETWETLPKNPDYLLRKAESAYPWVLFHRPEDSLSPLTDLLKKDSGISDAARSGLLAIMKNKRLYHDRLKPSEINSARSARAGFSLVLSDRSLVEGGKVDKINTPFVLLLNRPELFREMEGLREVTDELALALAELDGARRVASSGAGSDATLINERIALLLDRVGAYGFESDRTRGGSVISFNAEAFLKQVEQTYRALQQTAAAA